MNKENLLKEYKKIPVKYSTGTGMLANYHRGQGVIFVYDGFFLKEDIEQIGILEHEYGHSLYEKFTNKDILLWNNISNHEEIYISPYAEKMSTFLKGPNEEFAECCRVLEQVKIKKTEEKLNKFLNPFLVIKLNLTKFFIKKYEDKNI